MAVNNSTHGCEDGVSLVHMEVDLVHVNYERSNYYWDCA